LIEIYSQRVADFFGPNNPAAPTIPKYIPSPEGLDAPLASNYPLYVTSPHPKFGRHSQWHNVAWSRDEYQARISGYEMVRINPVDAKARGIKTGDVVRLYNDRGAILCGANVTERMRPGVIQVWDYGVYAPLNPGNPDSLDAGGDVHVVLPSRQPEPLVQGMIVGCRVQVAKWSGS
jgi:anaerobic selenocysteine-containing dehydrogenase